MRPDPRHLILSISRWTIAILFIFVIAALPAIAAERADSTWLPWALSATALLLVVVGVFALLQVRFNRKLAFENRQRMRTEQKLQKSKDEYRALFERTRENESRFKAVFEHMASGGAIYEAVADGEDFVFKDINIAGAQSGHLEREAHIGKAVTEVYPDVKQMGLFEVLQRVWRTGRAEHLPLARYEDNRIFLWVENYVCKLPSGEILAVYDDVSERKITEEALRESEEKYRGIFENAVEGFFQSTPNGRFISVNPAFANMLGYRSPQELVETISDIEKQYYVNAEDRRRYRRYLQKHGHIEEFEFKVLRKDGIPIWVSNSTRAYFDDDGEVIRYEGIVMDITQRKLAQKENEALQTQLRQAQKLESIGHLAGGIAHDFNNILSSILGFAELTLEDIDKGTLIDRNLQEIYAAGLRAKDLVKQILTFARQTDEIIKPLQVDKIIKEVLTFIRSSIPTSIEINQRIDSSAFVMGNDTQIHQVLMNLCTNAAQAMEDKGGILDVGLKDVIVDDQHPSTKPELPNGSYLVISVSDTGVGIAPQIIDSIFDPYFTTKGPGEGTGMGLAVVHGIIESYSGNITIDSAPGRGTKVTVYLPATTPIRPNLDFAAQELPSGHERVLFVDDEAPIARMGGQILTRLGYTVETRTSSVEALALFRSRSTDFDLVITDMTMPNMTGDRLAAEIIGIRPDMPVIICTGYSKKFSEDTAARIGIKAFVHKPVVKTELAKTVRRVLDAASDEA